MSVQEIRPFVESWCESGEAFAVALLTETWASAPRRPGARFARSGAGEIAGNVSAGCVEADLSLRLERILSGSPPAFVEYGVSDEEALGVGLSCGGRMRLFLRQGVCDDPVWPCLFSRLDSGQPTALVTLLDPAGSRQWVLDESWNVLAASPGTVPAPPEPETAGNLFRTGGSRLEHAEGGPDRFLEVFLPPRRLIIVGGTPIGTNLARLAAAAGIPVAVVEPREAYGTGLDDSGVKVLRQWPAEALEALAVDASCAVAVLSHDSKLDVPALATALESGCGYVGLLGGRRTREARFEQLSAVGVPTARLAEVKAPIGIDIGAETPAEIAVSILAQVIAAWRGA